MRDANTRPITACCCFQNLHGKSIWIGLRDRNDDGTFSLVALRGQRVKASCVRGGFPRVFTWYSRMLLTPCSSDCSEKLLPPRSAHTAPHWHRPHNNTTARHRLNRNIWHQPPQIPVQGPFTFMWLMSRVFKAARSSLKLYYHWFPWKHDDETFYYSQCFMECLLRRSTEHLPRMCSQVKPLIKCRIPRNAGNNGKFSLPQVDVDWGLWQRLYLGTEEQWNIRFNWK